MSCDWAEDAYFVPNLHPTLDMEEQRLIVEAERHREHVKWCDEMCEQQRLTIPNRRIALKMLLNEAYSRDLASAKRRKDSDEEVYALRVSWQHIGKQVSRDMEVRDNSPIVLKNLSCMCVFISDSICREYGENIEARQRRMDKMHEGIQYLENRRVLFHNTE